MKIIPFLIAIIFSVLILIFDFNQDLFLILNRLPAYTGDRLWASLTILGDGLIAAVLFLPWIRKRPDAIWLMLYSTFISIVIVHSLKPILNMPRPPGIYSLEEFILIGPSYLSNSFPSGHTTTIFTAIGVWCFSIRSRVIVTGLITLGYLVGLSRICVGVHWPLDVLAGSVIGWGSAWISSSIAKNYPKNKRKGMLILGCILILASLYLLFLHDCKYILACWLQRSIAIICLIFGLSEFRYLVRVHPEINKS